MENDAKKKATDFIVATGNSYSIKEFIDIATKYLKINATWVGKGLASRLILKKNNRVILRINEKFLRPNEIKNPKINSNIFKDIKLVRPLTKFKDLVKIMINDELNSKY